MHAWQARVRELGGLVPVLQRMQLDDNNPQIREWAVLAVRNLTEGCAENQARRRRLAAPCYPGPHPSPHPP